MNTPQKIPIMSKNSSNKSCSELNFPQETRRIHMVVPVTTERSKKFTF